MQIKVDFTIEIPDESMDALRELAGGVRTGRECRDFVRGDVIEYIQSYLEDNGVQFEVVRELM